MSISSEQADHAHFTCSTTRIETTVPLAELIPESSEYEDDSIYVWIHQGEGFIAAGKSASWQSDASTPDRRFSDAQHWWNKRGIGRMHILEVQRLMRTSGMVFIGAVPGWCTGRRSVAARWFWKN